MKFLLTTLLLSLLPALAVQAQEDAAKKDAPKLAAQTACPIGGGAIDKEHFVDYEGHRVYFCCKKCPEKFNEFPDKYMFAMYKAKVQPENIQTTCAVSGMKLENKDHFVQVQAKRIHTCCEKCAAKVAKNPAAYLDKMEGRKPQTKCPVMGGEIDKSVYTVVQGQKIYFCCPGCESKVKENPNKYFEEAAKKKVVFETAIDECPIMGDGEPVIPETFVTYKGRRVPFCCESCIKVFTKKPEKILVSI